MSTTAAAMHRYTPVLQTVDPRGLSINSIAFCRISAVDEPEARINRSAFDAAGRLVARWDPRLWADQAPANLTSIYSLSGQVLGSESVDAGWRLSLFGEGGQALDGWDGRGTVRRTEYDELLRPTVVFEDDDCVERLIYGGADLAVHNQCGQLIHHDDPAGTRLNNEFALTGEVIGQTQDVFTTHWRFNPLGEAIRQTDALGNVQRFAHTVAGQLKSSHVQLEDPLEQGLISAIGYDALGRVETETAGNGVVTTALYRVEDGRLLELKAKRSDAETIQYLIYDYDPVGNVIRLEDRAQPTRHFANQRIDPVSTYQYDTLYQLIEATGREAIDQGPELANYTQTYRYDAGGNLQQLTHVGAQDHSQRFVTARTSNRTLLVVNDQPPDEADIAAAFDANGNLLELQAGQILSWDRRNQLQRVRPVVRESGNDDSERYLYDASGQRMRKIRTTEAKTVTHTAEVRYLPGLEIRTDTATGETLHVICAQAGRSTVRVLHWQSGKREASDNDQVRYALADHLGSSTLELDKEAQIISQESYYPFGGTSWWAARNTIEANYKTVRYSGKERDATGLYYYGFRYYAPWLQRWINPDPAGAVDGLNMYCFVSSNPLNRIDPDGRNETPSEMSYLNLKLNVRPALMQRLASDKEKSLERLRSAWKISGQELGESLDRIIDYIESAPLSLNLNYSSVSQLQGDTFRNIHAAKSQEPAVMHYRNKAEHEIMNITGATAESVKLFDNPAQAFDFRPIYGAVQLHARESATGAAPLYGNSAFYLGEQMLGHLTFTASDSFRLAEYMKRSYEDEGFLFERTGTIGNIYPLVAHADSDQLTYYRAIVQNITISQPLDTYVEWQAHGEVGFGSAVDLFSTTVSRWSPDYFKNSRRVNAFLKAHNIQAL